MPTPDDYDLREATEVMGRYALGIAESDAYRAAHEANAVFLAALTRLSMYGFQVATREDRAIFTTPNGARVEVAYAPSGRSCYELALTRNRREFIRDPVPVSLDIVFDPATNMFCGTTIDERIAAEPGKPRPMRSALAVVAKAVIAAFAET